MNFAKISDSQYQILASRRQSYDLMLWQTPVISLTALAFLFTIALGTGPALGRVLAAVLAFAAALSSLHLLAKHRFFELYYAEVLRSCEIEHRWAIVHKQPPLAPGLLAWSAYSVWKSVFILFAAAAVGVAVAGAIELSAPSPAAVPTSTTKSICPGK